MATASPAQNASPAPPKPQAWKAPPAEAVKSSFERFELKFWLPEKIAQEAVKYASPHMAIDAFSPPGVGQHNTSVYLDTPNLDYLRDHMSSLPDRYKLRVRQYGNPPAGDGFFEVKRKVKGVIVKKRAKVPERFIGPLLSGTYDAMPDLGRPTEQRNLEAFMYLLTVRAAEPKVIVSARREAFASVYPEEDVRLTLDREIVYQPATGFEIRPSPEAWVPIDTYVQHGEYGARVMTELKFRGIAPTWMNEMVEALAMYRVGYSKYVSAMLLETEDMAGVPGWRPAQDWRL